ncbi:MAG TPA: ABC transporter permease [Thermoleophilaceae bacterium]|nr:ABC transporter permease [Thermoleophilaceae bacterium]
MRWLVLKDLQILRRSPLLVALLVLYPIVVAVLIGLALSRGPDKPRVAFLSEVPPGGEVLSLGGEEVDTSRYSQKLFEAVDPVRVDSREEARELVRDGDVLGALIIPSDITFKLQRGLEPAIEVLYNAEDPVKAQLVQDTIKSQVQDANAALSRQFTGVALDYLDLLVSGGTFSFLGREIRVLGLGPAERILAQTLASLPPGSPARGQIQQVVDFARLARENLDLSDEVLGTVGEPIRVDARVVEGAGSTPLSSFAVALAVTVSLMFVTLLLAAGTLALEREENAFRRLVRGLVSRTALLGEKIGLAAACSLLVALAMLAGLALFVELDWSRAPLWVVAAAAGALGFAAMGAAIGALAREVRAASLLAFMTALPVAFVALVPSGTVSGAVYDMTRVISALFPFDPALTALGAALDGSGEMLLPLAHLLVLTLAFAAAARLGLRRFG